MMIMFFSEILISLTVFFSDIPVWIIILLTALLISLIALYYYKVVLRKYLLKRCNNEEVWLPVTDEQGNVIGRVAQSVSMENPGMFQHLLIRLILWDNGNLYLAQRDSDSLFEKEKVDTPFEKILTFGKSIESTLEEMHEKYIPGAEKPIFLLKYEYENYAGKWQVLLYYSNLAECRNLNSLSFRNGKMWTYKQLKQDIGKKYFSEIFENELQFISVLVGK